MTGPEYDAEFEAFLKRRSPLHRRLSDIDNAEPSVEIDRLVLNRAREAIDTPSQPLFRSSRWALPLGLAATILIAFTVVLNVDRHGAKAKVDAAAPAAQEQVPAVARAAAVSESAKAEAPSVLSDSAVRNGRAAQTAKKAGPPAALAKRYDIPATTAPKAAPDPHASPEAWLREINRLRAAGKAAEADRELVAFREAYPTHPAYSVAKPPAR
jgi:resuscitation-promoting factor RpfA